MAKEDMIMYKETISIELQLKKIANDNPEYGELWSTWNLNKKTLEPILNAIIKDYPHYSYHDYSHSESILLNIEKALGNENIEKLSPTDLWLLLHVAYLHDFGMVILDTKIHDFWMTSDFREYLEEQKDSDDEEFRRAASLILSSGKEKTEYDISWSLDIKEAVTLLTSKYCRWRHGDFSREYILDVDNIWGIDLGHNGLIKKRFILLIADISAIHTKKFDDIYKLHKEANGFKGDYIHPRLIASLLRLGDVLDLDNGRFNRYGEKIFGKMPNDSKIHYGKHESTSHVLINSKSIEVEADCPTDAVYRETRRWYDLLQKEINQMHLNWGDIATPEFDYPPYLASCKILRNGIEDSQELSNLKFTISQSKAFEILEGSSIYKDRFSCIREIVQNAEDATKIQLWRDIKNGMFYSENGIDKAKVERGTLLPSDIPAWIYEIYSVEICVEKDEKNDAVISIVDHGTGISLDSLKAICNVGQSYFQKKERKQEIDEMPVWLRPTASFGIGLQSCFMITDKITIYTNSNRDGSYKLTFKSGKQEGYVNVESIKDSFTRGSNVILEIENSLNFSFSLWGFTAKNLEMVEPLESNCVILYKIIESIFQECDSSFFKINIKSETIKYQESISPHMSVKDPFPKNESENGYLYSLSDNKRTIKCWYNNNLYKIRINKNTNKSLSIRYKGKSVRKTKINSSRYRGFDIEVDIYGMSTKEALSLNREELSGEASVKVWHDIYEIIQIYFDLLTNQQLESIKNDSELADAFMLTSWLYEREFPQSLFEYVSKERNIRVMIYDEQENIYKSEKCSLQDIVEKFPQVPYINREIANNRLMSIQDMTEERLQELLNKSHLDKKKYRCLIIDNDLKQYLMLDHYDIMYLDVEEEIGICVVRTDDELYSPDAYTKQQLIRGLVYRESGITYGSFKNVMRSSIPAFKEYEVLAVKLKNQFLMGGDNHCKWKIISPISLEDFKKIRDFSKDSFIEYIITRPVFSNLLDYVIDNGRTKNSKAVITVAYKKLIDEFYDIEMNDLKAE